MIKNTIDNPKLKAGTFKMRFLEAGVVQYENEMVLIRPENLMTIAQKFNGAKIIIDHQEVNETNAAKEIVGYASNIRQEADNWAWCDFTVNDEEATELINKGFKPSCAYLPVATGSGGTKNNVPYDREIIDIVEDDTVTHIAIVENPRYEDAIILKNSIKSKMKNIFKFTSKKEVIKENSVKEIDLDSTVFDLDGEEVPVSNLVTAYKNQKDEEDKEKENECDDKAKVNADSEFEVDGKMVKVSEMAKAYKSAKKNQEDEEKKNAEDEEKKNAEDEEEKEEKKKEAKKNSVDAEKISKAKEAFENGTKVSKTKIITDSDRFALGAAAYGEPQKITK